MMCERGVVLIIVNMETFCIYPKLNDMLSLEKVS